VGFISFSLSLFALVLGLVRGNDDGWGSTKIVGLFIAAAVLMLIFFVNEARRQDPMLPLKLFEKPAVIGVSGVAFALSGSIFAMFLYLTLYVQDSLGYGPLPAGERFLPLTLLAFIVAPFAGRLTVRIQSRFLLGGGLLLVAIGLFLMSHTHPDSGWTVLLPGFIICGAGIGMVNPVLASASISVVPPQESGMASGTNNTFRQVGIATGIAVLGAIFQSQIVSHTRAILNTSAIGKQVLAHGGAQLNAALAGGGVREAAASSAIPAVAKQPLIHAYQIGFSATLNHLMLIAAVIALVGSIMGFALVRQRDFVAPAGAPAVHAG
jgi:predicted MFS family arabinose efflux permease